MLTPLFNSARDHYWGDLDAPVELIQYGGYQCRYSGDLLPVIRQLRECLGDGLRYVFRHFPLPTLHYLAMDAAMAAEAAGMQAMFWPMHEKILENQLCLNQSSFSFFAEDIGLDPGIFERHRSSRSLYKKINGDFESGIRSGVSGTPTFFINGLQYNGFDDFTSLYKVCRCARNYHKMFL
jgi:protein-disulfide isomerase